MDNEPKKRCCYVCKHHVDFVGEKGYCKLYHHETLLPEDACPLFEPCEDKNSVASEEYVHEQVPSRTENNSPFKNILSIVSLFSCVVLMIIELFFGVNSGMMIASSEKISSLTKFLVIFFGVLLLVSLLLIFFRLSKKSVVAQIFVILFTIAALIVIGINHSLWFTVFQHASIIAEKYLN